MRRLIVAFVLLLVPVQATAANWWKASTDHFIVYSETSEQEAADLAVELERFDEAMRYLRGIAKDTATLPESAKLTVYQFGDINAIGQLAGQRGVAGFFIPRAGQSVAFVPAREPRVRGSLGARPDEGDSLESKVVLFHEYAHYFMYQHAAAAYPAWYREGFAEVYGTVEFIDDGFRIGNAAKHRGSVLRYLNNYHVSRLLDPPEEMTGEDGAQIYALGWLLSHYLTFTTERPGQLDEYLKQINAGKSSREAAEQAFGDLNKLNRDLDTYRRGRVQGIEVSFPDYQEPEATVRPLTAAEEAQMMLHITSTRGVDEDEAERLVPDARSLVQRYPSSVPVLLAAVEAEFDAENYAQAETLANKVVSLDDGDARARIYLARIAMSRAEEDPTQFKVARDQYAAANRLEPDNPDPLNGYYLSFRLANETPPEDALIALEQAYLRAPFSPTIRTNLAHLLLLEKRDAEAVTLLGPLINDPHAGKRAKKLRELADKVTEGERAEAIEELAPSINPDEDEEDEDEQRTVG
jgi:Flp pilus assembly protein TadD